MTVERLPDRWHSRDFPVLLETARLLDEGYEAVEADELLPLVNLEKREVQMAWEALARDEATSYLEAKRFPATLAQPRGDLVAVGLTERGRRAVGLWPDQEAAADALTELLQQAADGVDDPDDASTLRKAGRLLRSVPSAVLADVTAALIRQQAGL